METKDYRRTDLYPMLATSAKKAEIAKEIDRSHGRAESAYAAIANDPELKKMLVEAYGGGCAYCGVPLGAIPLSSFEIDHIVCQKHPEELANPEELHALGNLASACHVCNSWKRSFRVTRTAFKLLSPDESLGTTFVRNDRYGITISRRLEPNNDVGAFFKQMRFDCDLRRVDYLLAGVRDLLLYVEQVEMRDADSVSAKLHELYSHLMNKRNYYEYDLREAGRSIDT